MYRKGLRNSVILPLINMKYVMLQNNEYSFKNFKIFFALLSQLYRVGYTLVLNLHRALHSPPPPHTFPLPTYDIFMSFSILSSIYLHHLSSVFLSVSFVLYTFISIATLTVSKSPLIIGSHITVEPI